VRARARDLRRWPEPTRAGVALRWGDGRFGEAEGAISTLR
jgi:hypothetical protein